MRVKPARPELLVLETCYQLALSYRAGNFVRYFRGLPDLPLLLLLSTRHHCDLMLDRAVTVSKTAYRQTLHSRSRMVNMSLRSSLLL